MSREMMKTKVAVAISLAGVLAAGTAAALVNTRVLNGGSSSTPSAAAETQPGNAAEILAPNVSTPVVSVPASVVNSPTQATYAVGSSGTVTLDTAGDVLTVAAAAPAAGWTIIESESDEGGTNAEVKFQNGTVEVDFHANLLYGVVRTSVESQDLSTTNGTVSGGSGFDDQQIGDDDSGQATVPGGDDDGGGGDD
jgi:hypothetical protein